MIFILFNFILLFHGTLTTSSLELNNHYTTGIITNEFGSDPSNLTNSSTNGQFDINGDNYSETLNILSDTSETSDLYFEPEKLRVEEVRGWVIFASLMIVLLNFIGQLTYYKILDSTGNLTQRNYNFGVWFTGCMGFWAFIFGMIFMLVFWLSLYPDVIDYETWIETNITTESLEENPYRCCKIVNCYCNEYGGSNSCSSLVNNLEEGRCGNGYECCQQRSYDCNCRDTETCRTNSVGNNNDPRRECTTTTTCDTCYECISDVGNEQCEVVCGTCYSPEVILSYPDHNEITRYITETESCGRDDYSCVTDFFDGYGGEVNYTAPGYFDPFNYQDYSYSPPEINKGEVIFISILGGLIGLQILIWLGFFVYGLGSKVHKHHSSITKIRNGISKLSSFRKGKEPHNDIESKTSGKFSESKNKSSSSSQLSSSQLSSSSSSSSSLFSSSSSSSSFESS